METPIKKIKNIEDCVGLKFGEQIMFGKRKLVYAGITKYAPRTGETDGRVSHRMIRVNETNQQELIEYELSEQTIAQRVIFVDNPLYYPYKEMLEGAE